jgi:hypothetical protein
VSGDRPTAAELLEEVRRWLAEEHAPTLAGGPRFEAMIAAHALGIAARELALGPAHAEADRAELAALAGAAAPGEEAAQRRTLATALRAGEHAADLASVAAVLREHVRRKLALARPGYDS